MKHAKKVQLPSSALSLAEGWLFRIVEKRETTEFDFKPPRYLEVCPFPDTIDVLEFVLPDSPASLMLRRCPESENNLSDT